MLILLQSIHVYNHSGKGDSLLEQILDKAIEEYFDMMVTDLQKLIKIRSVLEEDNSRSGAPFGDKIDEALNFVLDRGKALGLETKNVDGYAGYIEIGSGKEMVGILGHVDVVPEGSGWSVDPYGGEIKDGKLYGRGSLDYKGPIIACLYALKAIKESGLPIQRRARLIIGTDEETGGRCIKYYLDKEEKPAYGFSPDANFPIIYAEKGILRFSLEKEFKQQGLETTNCPIIETIKGGTRVNVVPDYAEAHLSHVMFDSVQQAIKEKGLNNWIKAEETSSGVLIKAFGVPAHAMQPKEGINAIQLLLCFLKELDFGPYDVKLFINLLANKLDKETDGRTLGIECQDEISGKLTMNVGTINYENMRASIRFDIRYPVTEDAGIIIKKLEDFSLEAGAKFKIDQHKPPLHVNKDSLLIKKLKKVYEKMTGEDAVLLSIGGGTYCRYVENTVSFGPVFPGQKELAHQKDEYISLENLKRIAKIYVQAVYELIR